MLGPCVIHVAAMRANALKYYIPVATRLIVPVRPVCSVKLSGVMYLLFSFLILSVPCLDSFVEYSL